MVGDGYISNALSLTSCCTGKVAVQSLTTSEHYVFDLKRPMRSVTLEPNFGKRSTRQLVSGGMAGSLILHEKGWLGHKEVVLHSGEGPIWATEWRGTLIAWANDAVSHIHKTERPEIDDLLSGCTDIRYLFGSTNHFHLSRCRFTEGGLVQVHDALARRSHAPHRMG